jgi:aquaporin Z
MNLVEFVPEFLGTFALIFSILSTGNWLIIGLTLAAVIFLVGDISGSNVNPAVSIAMFLTNTISLKKMLWYWLAQILGAISAVYTYKFIVKHVHS